MNISFHIKQDVLLFNACQIKPDKFEMKFWLLAEADSKYLCNGKTYLEKDSPHQKGNDLSTDICLTLLKPYFKKVIGSQLTIFFLYNLADY